MSGPSSDNYDKQIFHLAFDIYHLPFQNQVLLNCHERLIVSLMAIVINGK
jgi:hypothetical protein